MDKFFCLSLFTNLYLQVYSWTPFMVVIMEHSPPCNHSVNSVLCSSQWASANVRQMNNTKLHQSHYSVWEHSQHSLSWRQHRLLLLLKNNNSEKMQMYFWHTRFSFLNHQKRKFKVFFLKERVKMPYQIWIGKIHWWSEVRYLFEPNWLYL